MFWNRARRLDMEHEHRLTAVEDRSKSNTHRIDNMEPVVKEIHTMSATLVTMAEGIKQTNLAISDLIGKVDKIDSRVDEIEKEPGKEWKNTKNKIIDKVVGLIVGFLVAGLIWAAVQAF